MAGSGLCPGNRALVRIVPQPNIRLVPERSRPEIAGSRQGYEPPRSPRGQSFDALLGLGLIILAASAIAIPVILLVGGDRPGVLDEEM